MGFYAEAVSKPMHPFAVGELIRVHVFLSQQLEVEDKTGLNKRGNAWSAPKGIWDKNSLMIEKKEKLVERYLALRPYLTNIFREGLRFDKQSVVKFCENATELLRQVEKTSSASSQLADCTSKNPFTKFYECEFCDPSFIRVLLAEFTIMFHTIENRIELHTGKYPLFGKEEKRGLEKVREFLKKINEKVRLEKNGVQFDEFLKRMLDLELKWIDWKNRKCAGQIFKRDSVELQKRFFKRQF